VADAVRGILDGHIVLERGIAERGRYPAVNVLRSLSRTMPNCNTDAETEIVRRARQHLSVYEDMAELIRLGAYRKGTDPAVDEAIELYGPLEEFLGQKRTEKTDLKTGYNLLADIVGLAHPDAEPVGKNKKAQPKVIS
ncbi:MAG: flagellum-specific ATP synthase FliI, partial [Dongiaceae bacterium]